MTQIPLSWQLDAITWQLGGVVVLLALLATLLSPAQDRRSRRSVWLLAAATITTVSATSVAAMMMGWTAVAAVWLWLLPSKRATYWLLLPLLGYLAAVSLGQWAAWAGGALLVTAVLQMGVWPFSGWRALQTNLPAPLVILLYTYAPLAGLSLLARLPQAAQIGLDYGLVVAALGLLGVLAGLRQTWSQLTNPTGAVAGLAQVQVNVALLTAVWGSQATILAEARLLLAVAVLYLAVGHTQVRWHRFSPLAALLALVGLPLTVGFAARAALYAAWWANGRILLVFVLALMHIPLVTAAFWLIGRHTASNPPIGRLIIAWFLPLVGLIGLGGLGDTPLVVWLALLLPLVLGLAATRWDAQLDEVRTVLRHAFMFTRPPFMQNGALTAVFTNLGLALREAARILEGEHGLLWLLAFVVILLLVRQ